MPLEEPLAFLGIFWRKYSLLSFLGASRGLVCYFSPDDGLLCKHYCVIIDHKPAYHY